MIDDRALFCRRRFKHCVQRDDERRCHAVHQFQNQIAAFAAEYAEFVLKPDRIDAVFIDAPGRNAIILGTIGADDAAMPLIFKRGDGIVDDVHVYRDFGMMDAQLFENVCRERGDAALPGIETADQRNPARADCIIPAKKLQYRV